MAEQSMYRSRDAARTGASAWATGLLLFAAVFMVVGGSFHAIQGLAALINDDFFENVQGYAYDVDITTWGWLHLIVGIVVALTGITLLTGAIWARIIAMFIMVVSAIINFIYIPYQPLWSIVLLVIDGAIIWALLTYPEPEGGAP
jgi:hypothetical protein